MNCFGNNNCSWIIILVILVLFCGGNGCSGYSSANNGGCGCSNSCGCC